MGADSKRIRRNSIDFNYCQWQTIQRFPVRFFDHIQQFKRRSFYYALYKFPPDILGTVGSQRLIEHFLPKSADTTAIKSVTFIELCVSGHFSVAK
jgi:hypothetical protein